MNSNRRRGRSKNQTTGVRRVSETNLMRTQFTFSRSFFSCWFVASDGRFFPALMNAVDNCRPSTDGIEWNEWLLLLLSPRIVFVIILFWSDFNDFVTVRHSSLTLLKLLVIYAKMNRKKHFLCFQWCSFLCDEIKWIVRDLHSFRFWRHHFDSSFAFMSLSCSRRFHRILCQCRLPFRIRWFIENVAWINIIINHHLALAL